MKIGNKYNQERARILNGIRSSIVKLERIPFEDKREYSCFFCRKSIKEREERYFAIERDEECISRFPIDSNCIYRAKTHIHTSIEEFGIN